MKQRVEQQGSVTPEFQELGLERLRIVEAAMTAEAHATGDPSLLPETIDEAA